MSLHGLMTASGHMAVNLLIEQLYENKLYTLNVFILMMLIMKTLDKFKTNQSLNLFPQFAVCLFRLNLSIVLIKPLLEPGILRPRLRFNPRPLYNPRPRYNPRLRSPQNNPVETGICEGFARSYTHYTIHSRTRREKIDVIFF